MSIFLFGEPAVIYRTDNYLVFTNSICNIINYMPTFP